MNNDEIKNRISMALKDPVLQQGFESICKENAELEQKLEQTEKDLSDYQFNYPTIKELQKENAELKNRDCWKSCEYANPKAELIEQHLKDVQNLAKAKDIIKDYIIVTKGDHCTVCGVPEENRSINVLKLNEQAEQFLKESE